MTAAATKPSHEPEERADPIAALLNTMLVQVEDTMRLIIAHGGEGPLKTRIDKLFPPVVRQDALAAQTARVDRITADASTALALVYCTEVLRKHMHRLGASSERPRENTQLGIDILLAKLREPAQSANEAKP